ncbi:MAG: YfhO family protein [Crocinitomicaceae bacterium]|nr:YfhO family protein [Crocinitomicaceae bacterium]
MNRLKEILLQKSNLWHVGAIALFVIIASIFFYPGWSGYNIEQGDVTNWVGASQEIKDFRESEGQPGWTNSMFSGMPATQISMDYEGRDIPFFLRDVYRLWLPRPISILFIYFLSFYIMAISFRMKPIVAIVGALAFGLSSSQLIIIEAGHLTKAFAIGYAPLLIAGMVFAYRWKNWILGVGLSALFMTFELSANHLQITYYMAFVLIGLGIVEFIRHYKKEGGVLRFAKITGGLMVAYAIALMVNMGNIIGTNEYAKYTTRGGTDLTITADGQPNEEIATSGLDREYITNWSYGKGETFTFIVPNFKGGETMRIGDNDANKKILKDVPSQGRQFVKGSNQYWGDQPFTSGPVYLGIIVVFLALLSFFYTKEKFRWALLIVTVITVMLSWGKNFMGFTNFFLDYVPGYNKFRAVTIILAVAQLSVPLLGAMFLHRLVKARDKIKENLVPFYAVGGSLAFILLIFLAIPTTVTSFISDAEIQQLNTLDVSTPQGEEAFNYWSDQYDMLAEARADIMQKDAIRSFALLALSFLAVLLFIRGVYNKYILGGALAILILFDLGGVSKRYINTEKRGRNYEQWVEVWKQKLPYSAGNGDLEIFNREVQKNPDLLFAVDSALNATDFSDMENKEKARYMDWVKFRTLNRYTNYRVMDMSNPFNSSYASYFHKSIGGYHGAKLGRYQELIEFHIGKANPAVLDMLNMKYQIASQPTQSGDMNSQFVKENPTAMGNAWFTKNVKMVENADEEIMALESSNAAKLSIGKAGFPVYINGEQVTETTVVTGQENVYFLFPSQQVDGSVVYDTIKQQLPVQQAAAFDLSLIPGQKPGTWNWAYDEMLDSTFNKIMTLTTSGRIGWDPLEETVVDNDFSDQISQQSYSGEGTITMTSYHPDNLVYKSSSPDKQLAVFSEIYYPLGWKAYIDGEEVPIIRVNYVLRAIEVPAGEHTIEFAYNLPSFKRSGTFSWIGSILVLLMIGAGIFYETKRTDEATSEEEGEDETDAEEV